MKGVLVKWGNSAALRIPTGVVQDAGWHIGQVLSLRTEGHRVVIEPAPETLEELVSRITPQNCHSQLLEDEPRGKELW